MNDFTKEELIHLFGWAISLADLFPNIFCESDVNLYNKLHSMIANYCECQPSTPLMALIKQCNKCKRPMDYRFWDLAQGWINDNQ